MSDTTEQTNMKGRESMAEWILWMAQERDMDGMELIDVCSIVLLEVGRQCHLSREEMGCIVNNRMGAEVVA